MMQRYKLGLSKDAWDAMQGLRSCKAMGEDIHARLGLCKTRMYEIQCKNRVLQGGNAMSGFRKVRRCVEWLEIYRMIFENRFKKIIGVHKTRSAIYNFSGVWFDLEAPPHI